MGKFHLSGEFYGDFHLIFREFPQIFSRNTGVGERHVLLGRVPVPRALPRSRQHCGRRLLRPHAVRPRERLRQRKVGLSRNPDRMDRTLDCKNFKSTNNSSVLTGYYVFML